MKKAFRVKGTHCRACKALIEDVCGDIPGVKRCTVDFGTGNMVVEYEGKPDWNALRVVRRHHRARPPENSRGGKSACQLRLGKSDCRVRPPYRAGRRAEGRHQEKRVWREGAAGGRAFIRP